MLLRVEELQKKFSELSNFKPELIRKMFSDATIEIPICEDSLIGLHEPYSKFQNGWIVKHKPEIIVTVWRRCIANMIDKRILPLAEFVKTLGNYVPYGFESDISKTTHGHYYVLENDRYEKKPYPCEPFENVLLTNNLDSFFIQVQKVEDYYEITKI